jgi:hypothetical protein
MDVIELFQDQSVDYVTEGHKHARKGWANVECPWCTGEHIGYHLGYNLEKDYFFCWRCGWHPVVPTISKLLKIPQVEAIVLIRQYGLRIARRVEEPTESEQTKPFSFPTGNIPLTPFHEHYLKGRGFDPDMLRQIWGISSTGPISKLDKYDYKNRILIPYHWNGTPVTFDTRVPLKLASHEKRYKACPLDREKFPRKDIVYGRQEEWRETGILVEGPTDVWRLGTSSFATSGIQYTPKQIRLISNIFKRVAVCFDNEPQAIKQATQIVAELKFRGVDAFRINVTNDPGSMGQEDADYLVKQIMK